MPVREPKPCPYCDQRAHLHPIRDGFQVSCRVCMAAGPPMFHGPTTIAPASTRALEAWDGLCNKLDWLSAALKPFAETYRREDDPGVSDLDDAQPVRWPQKLGDYRKAERLVPRG